MATRSPGHAHLLSRTQGNGEGGGAGQPDQGLVTTLMTHATRDDYISNDAGRAARLTKKTSQIPPGNINQLEVGTARLEMVKNPYFWG